MKEGAFYMKATIDTKVNEYTINLKNTNASNKRMKTNIRHCKKDLHKSMKNKEMIKLSKDVALELKKL